MAEDKFLKKARERENVQSLATLIATPGQINYNCIRKYSNQSNLLHMQISYTGNQQELVESVQLFHVVNSFSYKIS